VTQQWEAYISTGSAKLPIINGGAPAPTIFLDTIHASLKCGLQQHILAS